ncbi:uncharacterized protein A4U43_C10F17550 [Asparagus officinalis]|uniref:Two-component response regulator n=1 Tax=Asparagus officinalis TaxID=4686 RepID=A0A5P1E3G1_ASPOF|nr:two-component response regulator ORR26-like [Asparagus officinalis]ONK57192.1 uncharacterized protein A4U43_C10F17550 [Asparagus officinalis]
MENPSRAEAFPVGLRVLVVDDDPTWMKILEKMLRKCSYEVTTCGLATVALSLLRGRRDKFDIVISDVNMPDMDGFELLEQVGLEMDLPVIMMSVNGETSRVMKGVQHGACDYLLKPIRMKELRNIWQHVYRKKMHELKEVEDHDISEDIQMSRSFSEDFDDRQGCLGKRKDLDSKETSDQECNDTAAVKKSRVVWSVDLHQKFVNAVKEIGFDKVGPKKILDLMNIPGLTRENVGSHLQKYRLYLSRLQKQHEERSSVKNIQPDFNPTGPRANFQNSATMNQISASGRYVPITQNFQAYNRTPAIFANNVKSTVALRLKDQMGTISSVETSTPKQEPWSNGIPLTSCVQRSKHDHEPNSSLEDCSHLPLTGQIHQTTTSQSLPPTSIISVACNPEQKTASTRTKPALNSTVVLPVICTSDSVSVQVERGSVDSQGFGVKHETDGSKIWMSPLREPRAKNEKDFVSLPEESPLSSLQNIGCFENIGLNSMDIFQHTGSTSLTGFHSNWYDGLEFNGDYSFDPVEYQVTDDCLFV